MDSASYMQQLSQMGQMPDFKSSIAQAYEKPVFRPLVEEGAGLESQYLPTLFDAFSSMGTGAGDMSAAAKLAMVGGKLGRLGSRLNSNRSIQDFYGMQVNDLASQEANRWNTNRQSTQDLYNMAFQREQAAKDEAFRQQQLNLSRQQMNNALSFPAPPPQNTGNIGTGVNTNIQRETQAASLINALKALKNRNNTVMFGPQAQQQQNLWQNTYSQLTRQLQSLGYDTTKLNI